MVKGQTLLFTENDGTFLFSYFCVIYEKNSTEEYNGCNETS